MKNDKVYDACVIGAGASGLVAGAELAKRGMDTLIIEQNRKSGRKLYATGNGRCNIANAVISDSAYYYDGFATQVVTEGSLLLLRRYLAQLGIPLTEKNGYCYPQSLQASSVVWALTDHARLSGAEFLYDSEVVHVDRTAEGAFRLYLRSTRSKDGDGKTAEKNDVVGKNNSFQKENDTAFDDSDESIEIIRCNRLVLAMGSSAAKELGAGKDEIITGIIEDLRLPYIDFEPALCPLVVSEDVSSLAGVRTHVKLRVGLSMDRPELGERLTEEGELQLTEYGLSGIAVFNLSTLIDAGEKISIDVLPLWENAEDVAEFLGKQNPDRRIFGAMNGLLHEKLCRFFLCSVLGEGKEKEKLSTFSDDELLTLIREMKDWRLTVSGKKGDMGQARRGGVSTEILSPDTFQVRRDPRLAVTGELCNVTGRCGGYNLMFALISGIRAGQRL